MPAGCDFEITKHFSATMAVLIRYSTAYRAYVDWSKVEADVARPAELLPIVENLANQYEDLLRTYAMARTIVDACPGSDGARVLAEMLAFGDETVATSAAFRKELLRRRAALLPGRRRGPV